MTNDRWTDRLSEYLDDELASGERAALEAHLGTCADCRATLDDLRRVVARAQGLEDRPPATDLWAGVAERIGAGKVVPLAPRRRISFSIPQLAAASIALALLSGGGVWLRLRHPRAADTAVTPIPDSLVRRANANTVIWTGRTDAAIAELQDALERNEGRLDTSTVRVVRENLVLIDRAIAQARTALDADPGNAYLNLHLADTMRRKLELLRRINAIASAQS